MRKKQKPRIRSAVGDVVTEADIPTTSADVTFELFANRNREEIENVVHQYVNQHR